MVYRYTNFNARKVLRDLRVSRNLTQEQVAIKLGCTKGYISQIELGKTSIPSHRVLIKILEIYAVTPRHFEKLILKTKN
jgi:transcriptional regulator with XRE-family HTH domain